MAGEGINIEGPGHRRALYQVGDELVDPRKLFACPALGILLSSPEAQGENLVGFGIRQKKNYVHETWLVFEDRQDLIANSFGELSDLAGLGRDGDDSTEHSISPNGHIRHAEPTLDKFKGSIAEKRCRARKRRPRRS